MHAHTHKANTHKTCEEMSLSSLTCRLNWFKQVFQDLLDDCEHVAVVSLLSLNINESGGHITISTKYFIQALPAGTRVFQYILLSTLQAKTLIILKVKRQSEEPLLSL